MRGTKGPQGFPRVITGKVLGASGSIVYDLPHKGIHVGTLVAYDGNNPEPVAFLRGTGTNGADQIRYGFATASTPSADYTYTPGGKA